MALDSLHSKGKHASKKDASRLAFGPLTAHSCPRCTLKDLWLDFPLLSGATRNKLSQVGHHPVIDCTSNVESAEAENGLGKRLTSTRAKFSLFTQAISSFEKSICTRLVMITRVKRWKCTRYECSMLTSQKGVPSNSTRRFPLAIRLSETPAKDEKCTNNSWTNITIVSFSSKSPLEQRHHTKHG